MNIYICYDNRYIDEIDSSIYISNSKQQQNDFKNIKKNKIIKRKQTKIKIRKNQNENPLPSDFYYSMFFFKHLDRNQ